MNETQESSRKEQRSQLNVLVTYALGHVDIHIKYTLYLQIVRNIQINCMTLVLILLEVRRTLSN